MQILNKGNVNVVPRSRIYHEKPVHYLIFKDIEHNGFTDKKLVTKKASAVGTADAEITLNTLNEIHAAFFDRYLKNEDICNSSPLPFNQQTIEKYEVL